ncbi:MAG: pantetheine-phosphate adenylyltransferase [Clostridiales bacterium]|nr:pantetheine-phosphate adenylyltransferase [Clostridiales bacterium]
MSGKEKIAICPGSFDPVTLGHLDIITRSSKMFDKVIVVVAKNYLKNNYAFTPEERVELLKKCTGKIKNIEIVISDGLIADFAKAKGAVAIVKGLRAVSDFEYEFQQALTNKRINPEVETVFITTSAENMFLSSSVVKQVCQYGGDISTFVPGEVRDEIVKRLNGNKNIFIEHREE